MIRVGINGGLIKELRLTWSFRRCIPLVGATRAALFWRFRARRFSPVNLLNARRLFNSYLDLGHPLKLVNRWVGSLDLFLN